MSSRKRESERWAQKATDLYAIVERVAAEPTEQIAPTAPYRVLVEDARRLLYGNTEPPEAHAR